MKVYTLTGDKGTTALVGGQRVDKDCMRVEAYGTIDELNSHIGVLATLLGNCDQASRDMIFNIQNQLFSLGAYLATEDADEKSPVYGLGDDNVRALENRIDIMQENLPPMKSFVLPGGCPAAAHADVCRTVARRAERRIITLSHNAAVNPLALRYINRLSDFFFVLSRWLNVQAGTPEVLWQK
ncbi:MAG: cob(I)yrinic acid a,c-diamide adenosyltransferase [Muribaculaceae bacterium]|nr:cob(I)yrinic acid a,c-diamide adenosyltransferase [Muribaculaceae bacterium]